MDGIHDRELRPYRLRMRTNFRGITARRGCLISGSNGWGEFAPFDDYTPQMAGRWLASAIEQADGRWPQPVRAAVAVNAIIPAVPPEQASHMALASDCHTIKIKVGDADGLARVAAVRSARPDAALRVDVNGGWTVRQAAAELADMAVLGIEYAEQPVRSLAEMAALRDAVDVPLAADELIRVDRDFDRVREVADVAVLKVAPLGGVHQTLSIAERVGLPVVVSGSLDSSLGLAASLAAACSLAQPPLACGFDTGVLLVDDVAEPLRPVAGDMQFAGYPQPRPGLPVAYDDLEYWRVRVADAWRSLAGARGTVVE